MSLSDLYQSVFPRRCHELIRLGYLRLQPAALTNASEPAITGMLRQQIEMFLDEPDAPEWAMLFVCTEEQPENVNNAVGSKRPRIDICIASVSCRPRPRFLFEAKRLRDAASLSQYLGEDGMLALLDGYYGDLRFSGMIGYVQADTCADWVLRIKDEIAHNEAQYYAESSGTFVDLGLIICEQVFCSSHCCGAPCVARKVAHTLLHCH